MNDMPRLSPQPHGPSIPTRLGSCDTCRRRKTKCDMGRPLCDACVTHGWSCSYTVARKKPGPRQGSRQAKTVDVQRRLDRIEGLLQSQRAAEDVALSVSPAPGSQQGEQDVVEGRRSSEPTETSFTADIDSELPDQHLPFIDALRWTDAKSMSPDARASLSESSALSNLLPTAIQPPLSSDMQLHLFSLYFSRVTLPVPIFFEEKLYCDYNAGRVPSFLLNAMFSLSSRFSNESEVLALGQGSRVLAAQHFATQASHELSKVTRRNSAASIAEVKAAYLLAYHDLTKMPSRTAAERCSGAVRAAYVCRLHQLDNAKTAPETLGHLSDVEKEEIRCLWWGLFTLDTFSSMLSQVPSSIEDSSIATCLPSLSVAQAVASTPLPTSNVYLEDSLEEIWDLGGTEESYSAKVQAVLIYVVAIARDITTVRRLYDESPRCHLDNRLFQIRERWASLFRTLPQWFFSSNRHHADRTTENHRKRLEVLSMINIEGAIACFPPLNIGLDEATTPRDGGDELQRRWKTCISYALKVADAHRVWTAEYLDRADPIMLPITRLAACLLIFELMNSGPVLAAGKLDVLDSVDLLMRFLNRCSRSWGIVGVLLRSLEELRGQSWRKLSLKAIFQLLSTITTPQKQFLTFQSTEPPAMTLNSLGVTSEAYADQDAAMDLLSWGFPPMGMPQMEPAFLDG